ncbi:DUF2218 domain-containing protein [Pseudomonas sp. KB-10]|uniref:DUF2218 domain-containing protein n=1 Tax=Pseudomonas sp. KB-10 TaxID=2292264 RepID=UPI001BB0D437|nr:DUF2218 domain-containing protein [Pseudomonas sp. KB-10]
MFNSHAEIPMTAPGRCLTRLCRHWSHKFAVRFDETSAHIPFDPAVCELQVIDGGLRVTLQSPDHAELVELQGVVVDHLQRMAGETFDVEWRN